MNRKFKHYGFAAVVGMALGMGAMVNTASAGDISYAGAYTYIGDLNPVIGEDSGFVHTPLASGLFSDWWVFSINPTGEAQIDASFVPKGDISSFSINLYAVTAGTCTLPGAVCTGITTAPAALATSITGPASYTNLDFTTLAAGDYAFNVTGLVNDTGTAIDRYTGSVTTQQPVPEPATLALLGMGLLGLGAKRRQKKAAELAV